MTDVRRWLDSLELGQYAEAFEDNAIVWSLLSELDHEVLKDIGVSLAGHRLLILKSARELDAEVEASPQPAKPAASECKPAPVAGPGHPQPALRADDLTPFAGRRGELDLFINRWQAAERGQGQIVLLGGEPGIGKSRLVQALCEEMGAHTLVRFQCSSYQTINAFYPVVQHLARAAGFEFDDSDETRLNKLEDLLGGSASLPPERVQLFAELLSVPHENRYGELDLTPEDRKDQILSALHNHLISLSETRLVLLLVEDAHLIDPTTLAFLDRIARRSDGMHLLMVITHRLEWQTPAFSSLPQTVALTLERLEQEHAAGIAQAIGGSALTEGMVTRIVEHADGVPLFIEELTRYVLDSGADESSIPTTLPATLLARVERLGSAAKEILLIGSAIGRDFAHKVLAQVTVKSDAYLESAMQRLSASGLVLGSGTPPEATYSFKHELVQEVAYESLPVARRKELHSQIATALEGGAQGAPEDLVELIAFHAANADLPEKVLKYCLLAGEQGNERSAYSEAEQFLDSALEAVERLPHLASTPRQKLRALFAMTPSLGASGDYQRLLNVLSQAEQAAEQLGDKESAVVASIHRAHVLNHRGRGEPAIEAGTRALELAHTLGDERLSISASAVLGMVHFFRGDLRLAVATAAPYVDDLRTTYRHSRFATTATSSVNWLANLAGMYAMLGEFATAVEFVEEATTIAAETERPFDAVMAAHWKGMVLVTAGREDDAIAPLELTVSLCDKHRLVFMMPWGGKHLGAAYARSGQIQRGQEALRDSITKAEELGLTLGVIWGAAELAHADLQAGEVGGAIEHARAAREGAAGAGSRWLEAYALQALAKAAALSDDATSAEDHWDKAIALAADCEAKPLLAHLKHDFGGYLIRAGRTDEGHQVLVEALELYEAMGVEKWKSAAEATLSSAFV